MSIEVDGRVDYSEGMSDQNIAKFRKQAEETRQHAERAISPLDKDAWLRASGSSSRNRWKRGGGNATINRPPKKRPGKGVDAGAVHLRVSHGSSVAGFRMAVYRAYIVGADGHFVGFEPIVCADDTEAIEKADRLVIDHDVELWCGERLVRHLRVEDKPGGDASSHKVVDGRMVRKK
ncbi:MAG TPA: hypothetical protein VK638_19125 [Edaphobacter sp.]|nr:hypothetical protein [Edaphobacter sp.]